MSGQFLNCYYLAIGPVGHLLGPVKRKFKELEGDGAH